MRRIKLDKLTGKFFSTFRRRRMTNVDLAKKAGISAPPSLRRVKALEEAGFILRYHAILDSVAMGYGVTVFAQVKLLSQAETDLKQFDALVKSWPQVREAHMLAGETDFLLKIVAKDWDDYQKFLTEKLTSAPNVTSVKSSLAVQTTKHDSGFR